MSVSHFDILVIGGGAAGFFAALNIAEADPGLKIAILERGKEVLTKVRISGGGRCNVTHACFDPGELVKYYPRGEKELRGPFHTFAAGDTIEWFEKRGVELKIEDDGRMFPVTDSSQTIIDCFLKTAEKLKIQVLTGQSVQSIYKSAEKWKIDTQHDNFSCSKLIMATGSNPKIWDLLKGLGHRIIEPLPSLFTFNIKDTRIKALPGVSAMATVRVNGSKLEESGPLLITHWGMSGPAILKLSAWGARSLGEKQYRFSITVNWLHDLETSEAEENLRHFKEERARKNVWGKSPFEMVNRLWDSLVEAAGIPNNCRWADLSKKQITDLALQLTAGVFEVNGKSTFKDEFVTAGGIDLRDVNFRTMESKVAEGLYLCGEVLNIDAITGGFNFQNAWTGGYIVAKSIIN